MRNQMNWPSRFARVRRGVVIVEVAAASGALAVLGTLAYTALAQVGHDAMQSTCMSNQKQLLLGQNSYATDNRDRLATFSWNEQGSGETRFADLRSALGEATLDSERAAIQAVDILRRRSGRDDIALPAGWLPHPEYTSVVLQDYLASRLPERLLVCPSDSVRASWQEHAATFPEGPRLVPERIGDRAGVLPYSSSYEHIPAMYDLLHSADGPEAQWPDRLRQGNRHDRYLLTQRSRLGPAAFTDFAFPSGKVLMHDSHDRHSQLGRSDAGPLYFADGRASQPLGFTDGSVREGATADANPGWDPHRPNSPDPTIVTYAPESWERAGGENLDVRRFVGGYRWTRQGLKGVDFGGPEQGDPAGTPAGVVEVSR